MLDSDSMKNSGTVSDETLRKAIEYQRIGNAAVHKAQAENRKLGIPNWYSINGKIISDQDSNLADESKKPKNSKLNL